MVTASVHTPSSPAQRHRTGKQKWGPIALEVLEATLLGKPSLKKSLTFLHVGLTPRYFPESVTKNQFIFFNTRPFLALMGKIIFSP